MLKIYCPRCGGTVSVTENQRLGLCDRCGEAVPVPRGYTQLESSLNYAMEARLRRDFPAAQDAYDEIIKGRSDCAAAYWGRALSRYEVEYQPIDEVDWRLVCHQAQLSDFSADEDVRQALHLADGQEAEAYQEEARLIAALQKQVSAHAAVTEPYDVVVTADERNPVAMERAKAVCAAATAAGLRCLCPALELTQVPRQDWEPILHHAVNTAGAMVYVAVGTDSFPVNTRFDGERYLSRKAASQRAAAAAIPQLVIVYSGLDEYEDIPDSLFDGADLRLAMDGADFLDELCGVLTRHSRSYGAALHVENAGHENYAYTNLIRQARLALDGGDFEQAEDAYNQILSFNAGESQAYWGLVLAKHGCKNEEALIQKGALIREEGNYRSAVAFANEREAQTYQNVAQAAEEMYRVHEKQVAEQEHLRREQEKLRARKEQEVQEDLQQQNQKRAKARSRRTAIILLIIVVLAVGSYLGYRMLQTDNATEEKYQMAMNEYNGGDFAGAMGLFQELGDYKDSAEMVGISRAAYQQKRFYDAQFAGESLDTRAGAVETMRDLLEDENMTEAQEYLDVWLQEGEEYLAQGEYKKAYQALSGFGSGQAYTDIWRICQSQGLVSISDTGVILAVTASNGALQSFQSEHLGIEEGGSYTSVCVSDSGESAALVRSDGTAYLVGAVAQKADVSQWTDLRCIQTTDSTVVALKKDGTLLCSKRGTLTTGVKQFDLNSGIVAAVRADGTVYTSVEEANALMQEITDAAYIAVDYDKVMDNRLNTIPRYRFLVVDRENSMKVMAYTGDGEWGEVETDLPTGSIVAAITDAGCLGVLRTNGDVYSTGWDITNKVAFSDAYLVDFSEVLDLRIRDDGDGYGLNGMEEAQIAVRKYVNKMEDVGLYE